jgi:hypothetical protein
MEETLELARTAEIALEDVTHGALHVAEELVVESLHRGDTPTGY